jgi:hypothetical protein
MEWIKLAQDRAIVRASSMNMVMTLLVHRK